MEVISVVLALAGILISLISVFIAMRIRGNTTIQVYTTERIIRYNKLYSWFCKTDLRIIFETMIEANWYLFFKDVEGFAEGIPKEERNFTGFKIPENAKLVQSDSENRLVLLLGAQFIGNDNKDHKGLNQNCNLYAVISEQVEALEKEVLEYTTDIFIDDNVKEELKKIVKITQAIGQEIIKRNQQLSELSKVQKIIKISPNYISLIVKGEINKLVEEVKENIISVLEKQINKWKK